MNEQPSTSVIILAAGGGTRMRSDVMKVLHRIGGRSLVGHAVAAAHGLAPERVVAVIGSAREQVAAHLGQIAPDVALAVQEEQHGTAHAVQVGLSALAEEVTGTVLVVYGDVPLLTSDTLRAFVADHRAATRTVSVLTAEVPDPTGYGRIVRTETGAVDTIVEERDATAEQRAVREINSGILALDAVWLRPALARIGNDNAQGEYYLTDLVGLARDDGLDVGAFAIDDLWQTEGVNTRLQLARLGAELNRRVLERHMLAGVTVVDPDTTWVDVDVSLGRDVTLLPGVQVLGATSVGDRVTIGPDSTLTDMEVGADATLVRTHASLSVVEAGATVGPFAYLRPGTRLGAGGKVGTFVETKNADIGAGAKVPHLSYVGDAVIGEGANIGAGTIFANYDGVTKSTSTVGRHARTSSNNTFVAPVHIGDGAFTGAGTTVREDVPPGALAVSAGPQRTIEGWVERKRPGTPSADAAREASTEAPPTGDAAEEKQP